MLRITDEDVRDAVEKTGITLVSCSFGMRRNGMCVGCALTALFLRDTGGPLVSDPRRSEERIGKWAREKYGDEYASGFMYGFDNGDDDEDNEALFGEFWEAGRADGFAVRLALHPPKYSSELLEVTE